MVLVKILIRKKIKNSIEKLRFFFKRYFLKKNLPEAKIPDLRQMKLITITLMFQKPFREYRTKF